MADIDKLLRDMAGSVNKWGGDLTLPNGARLDNLTVHGEQDAKALAAFIKDMGGIEAMQAQVAHASNATVGERVDAYLEDLRNAGRGAGTLTDATNTLKIFRELVGQKYLMRCCTDAQVRLFLSTIDSWPVYSDTKPELKGLTAPEIVRATRIHNATASESNRWRGLAKRTRDKHRDQLAAFFNAQEKARVIEVSPMDGIPRHDKAPPDQTERRPLTTDELAQAFDLKTFLPWTTNKPHRWWGPLLGISTGARVNEVAQLYCDDLAEIAGVWGVYFRRGRPDQKLKKDTPARFVPLHPELLKAGLLAYRDDTTSAGHARLFPHLPWHAKAGYGDALGDQWRAYLDKIGLVAPGLGFHSFRHTVSTSLHYAGVVPAIQSAITGHGLKLPGSMSIYVHTPSLPQSLAAVSALPLPKGLPVYKPGDSADSLKQAHVQAKRRDTNRAARKRREAASTKLPPA